MTTGIPSEGSKRFPWKHGRPERCLQPVFRVPSSVFRLPLCRKLCYAKGISYVFTTLRIPFPFRDDKVDGCSDSCVVCGENTVGFRSIRAVSKVECGSASGQAADYRM